MELYDFLKKKVQLSSISGRTFIGVVCDYFYPEDNETNIESIALDYPVRDDGYKYEYPVEFSATSIKKIQILE